jgi:hypothetical protein
MQNYVCKKVEYNKKKVLQGVSEQEESLENHQDEEL